jgi:regulator of protease activity HflC (stomatin/prohibitin superfamily)
MKKEITVRPVNGYIIVALLLVLAIVIGYGIETKQELLSIALVLLFVFLAKGLVIISPNNCKVLLLFGNYKGSVKTSGLLWINPLLARTTISLKARNLESEKVKVNDKMGNPILISVILVWRVDDTFKACFEVDSFESFVKIQTDSAVRKLAGSFPYDHFEDERASITLSTNFDDVNLALEREITDRLVIAGLQVIEARIGYLAYAPEIAQAMLRRQQASAIVAARHKIVEGAVGMVENALDLLSKKQIIELDEDKKASMVSNLMVVLCSDKDSQPVINTGTLNQ